MSSCKSFGKDKVIFATKEDHATPSKIELPANEPSPGLLLPNGEINWNCPCLGGMATGPCGVEFREAFSCFHYSEADPKGSDCFDNFQAMQDCFSKYPTVYNQNLDETDQDFEKVSSEHSNVANEYVDPMQQDTPISNDNEREAKKSEKAIEAK